MASCTGTALVTKYGVGAALFEGSAPGRLNQILGEAMWSKMSEILLYISDMEKPASGLKAAILDRAEVPGSL
ncbi:hypothetical protein [Sphingopyxis sp. R3-92]|uniref:hypothetical protein n=1 Tax=Sphingopyxis sp. R3-92 TaxID=3158553 RepID=UPI003EE494BB